VSATSLSSPRLRRLARRTDLADDQREDGERCELCGAPIEAAHRHVLDLDRRQVLCSCRPCSLLFDRRAAARGRLRRVPDRPRALAGFALDPATWAALDIPVDIAWFVRAQSPVGGGQDPLGSGGPGVRAYYPSPLGPTESQLKLSAWSDLQAANPALAAMAPEVEALLVNRTEHHPGVWVAPITDCYRLVALMRTGWTGFSGGGAIWAQLDRFFDELDRAAMRPVNHT
jgi:hypothetical protein